MPRNKLAKGPERAKEWFETLPTIYLKDRQCVVISEKILAYIITQEQTRAIKFCQGMVREARLR